MASVNITRERERIEQLKRQTLMRERKEAQQSKKQRLRGEILVGNMVLKYFPEIEQKLHGTPDEVALYTSILERVVQLVALDCDYVQGLYRTASMQVANNA